MNYRTVTSVFAAGALGLLIAAPGMAEGSAWSYSGATGPDNWAALGYPACAGAAQSPIDLAAAALTGASLAKPRIHTAKGRSEVVNNGHSIEAETPEGTTIKLAGVTYPLAQIHFHRPSEHTVNGYHYPAEAHFVGKTGDGQIAVLGVFLTTGRSTNKAWQPYVAAAEDLTATGQSQEVTINYSKLLPRGLAGYKYSGSLTTPPCTEGVHWNLSATPVKLSEAQLEILEEVPFAQAPNSANNRPVQQLNSRPIWSNIKTDNGSD